MDERILRSMPMYDRGLAARVFPWTHSVHSWVGYVYVFDGPYSKSELVYFVPKEGQISYYVHRTRARMESSSVHGYTLLTDPDPDSDEKIGEVSTKPDN